ncbi:MAG TPA: thermonuclease family protein [Candidatus Paceibacterota bacterium]|nr:thermonuclease family protein [Candidatus Paceibacterota bacterium]
MFKKYKRILVILVLCAGVVGVSLLMMWGNEYKKNALGNSNKKFTSWALTVPIDPQKTYPVADVIDGDTLKIRIAGHVITTRLLGVNTPEVVDPRKPTECFGKEASEESKRLLAGKNVFVAINPDYERIDKFGRLLAYVWLSFNPIESTSTKLFVNEYLIKQGYGREYTFNVKNPYQYQKLFKQDQLSAQKSRKGLWGNCDGLKVYP